MGKQQMHQCGSYTCRGDEYCKRTRYKSRGRGQIRRVSTSYTCEELDSFYYNRSAEEMCGVDAFMSMCAVDRYTKHPQIADKLLFARWAISVCAPLLLLWFLPKLVDSIL